MSVILVSPGRPMLVAPRQSGLWGPLRASGGGTAGGGSGTPAAIPNLSGWWDASGISSLLDQNGNPIIAVGSAVGSLADKSGAGANLTVFYGAASGTKPLATPRLSGLLGGVGRSTIVPPALPSGGIQLPALDPDQGISLASAQMGPGSAWTRFLTWTRPNWRQASGKGKLYSFTIVHVPGAGFEDRVPYVIGLVEIDEGVRIVANLTGLAPQEAKIGLPVRVTWEPVGDTNYYAFEPDR